MRVLVFAATNHRQSINLQLAKYVAQRVKNTSQQMIEVELLDLNDYEMPIYSQDREEASGMPQLAHDFRAKISETDAIIIGFAEHNGTYSAAYKNVFDWTSRIDRSVYQNKPALLLATSPGPSGASTVLSQAITSAPYFDMNVAGSFSLPSYFDNFQGAGEPIKDAVLEQQLLDVIDTLVAKI
ncbi:NADPH-dependent oxidoreductase [Parashewanella curva]|uniref:NADPH-dependent oxidoreductase n=1 Tax=Parashewanella curva TaxID=2338552 RepID=A0A3L8PV22_9GAMM|nr:NAD(P)H-dependent oxidoreductase [Parashewanella curva]RLV59180.1 NADPH-dependent oxidoreductase [Parashewanella curva]